MLEMIFNILLIIGIVLWISCGGFVLYTTVRDDRRHEKERKENQDKKYYF